MAEHAPPDATTQTRSRQPTAHNLAGFGIRLVALLIDTIIIATLSGLFALTHPLAIVLAAIIAVGYFIVGTALGATIGKRAVGLRIVTDWGAAPGYGPAMMRYLVAIVSGIPLYLGYFWMLWDDNKQTWHDKAAGTYVIHA